MFSAMFSVSPCTRICARCTHVFCCTVYMLSASSCTCFLLHPVHAFCFILYMFSAAPCTCFLLHPVHVFCCTLCCCQMTVRKHICSTRTTDVDCRTSAADEIVEVLVVYLFVFTSMLWLFSFYWQILCFLHSCSRYMLTVYWCTALSSVIFTLVNCNRSRHANVSAFGRMLPLSRHTPAILRGINLIPLFKAILYVTESSKVAHFLLPNGLFQNVPNVVGRGSAPKPQTP